MATDLSATISQAAADPQSSTSDGQSTSARPIADLVAADRYLAQKSALTKRGRGLAFRKFLVAGALSDANGTLLGPRGFDGGPS